MYMGRPVSVTRKVSWFIGIVPGPPEGSGGPPGEANSPRGLRGPIVGRDQPLGGLGSPPPRPKASQEKKGGKP